MLQRERDDFKSIKAQIWDQEKIYQLAAANELDNNMKQKANTNTLWLFQSTNHASDGNNSTPRSPGFRW